LDGFFLIFGEEKIMHFEENETRLDLIEHLSLSIA
jgi:hypothetical protein